MKTVNILGTEYSIEHKDYNEDEYCSKNGLVGHCDDDLKQITICNVSTAPGWEDSTEDKCKTFEKSIARHEIIHAFLNESGLNNSSSAVSAWATNEEMVDWIAIQFPKILKAYQEVDAL